MEEVWMGGHWKASVAYNLRHLKKSFKSTALQSAACLCDVTASANPSILLSSAMLGPAAKSYLVERKGRYNEGCDTPINNLGKL